MIRKLNLGDLVRLEKFARFPMPNILNPTYEIQWAMIDDISGELVGIAIGKKTCEIMTIIDETYSWTTKTRAWLEAFDKLDSIGQILGYDDVHVFVVDEDENNARIYANLMKKLGFVDATGIPLYYTLGSSEWLKVKRRQQRLSLKTSQQVPLLKLKKDSSEAEFLVQRD